jgi:hypothetical protein
MMKKALSRVPFNQIALFVFGILTFSLGGCFDKDNDVQEPEPQSIVSFYHGSPDAPDLDILINTQRINSQPFGYSDYSNYVAFSPGTVRLKFAPVNAVNAFIDTALTFQQGKAYSLFVVDKFQQVDIMVVKDSLVAPAAGKARVRFINLSPDAPAVDVATTGASAANLFANVGFKGTTDFIDLTAGTHSLQVKAAGNGNVLLPVPNVDLGAGRIYTFVFRGFVTPPAGNTEGLKFQLLPAGS